MIRGDAPAGWRQDFGPAEDFEDTVTPLLIPSFGENTVAELQARAERNRHDDYWMKRAQEMRESSTLMQDAVAPDRGDREDTAQPNDLWAVCEQAAGRLPGGVEPQTTEGTQRRADRKEDTLWQKLTSKK